MAKASPQTFQKRQRERRKQEKREMKLERRLIRNEEKRNDKAERDEPLELNAEVDEDGNVVETSQGPDEGSARDRSQDPSDSRE
ncbi:MAG: hypothetical protein E2O39_09095 [Planctomycetota bacterium]|nr:MAG: hypothetical protein E2O39_09095 [Planctomycetota bacterium]